MEKPHALETKYWHGVFKKSLANKTKDHNTIR